MTFHFSLDLKATKLAGRQNENVQAWLDKLLPMHCELNDVEKGIYPKLFPLMLENQSPADIWFQVRGR